MTSRGNWRLRAVFGLGLLAGMSGWQGGSAARGAGLEAKGDYFPIGVWLQDPRNAERYKAIGINTYIALYRGPNVEQLAALEKAGMQVACGQNKVSLDPRWNKVVVGWIQGDEPDNAQSKPGGKGYGPPILPEVIVAKYREVKPLDPQHRPVMLNLGQGVAWDQYVGRGTRTNHPEDYKKYAVGSDVVSFDIYPACHENKQIAGKLSYVGSGVKRLVEWVDNKKPVWACIETGHIDNPKAMVTPEQLRSEVWMAVINGARGITYFAHEFKPKSIEAGLLAHEDIAASVKKVNAEIQGLASVINTGKAVNGGVVNSKDIALMTRQLGGDVYFFASEMADGKTDAAFTAPGMRGSAKIEVVGESRTVDMKDGQWTDSFAGYQAHIYHVKGGGK